MVQEENNATPEVNNVVENQSTDETINIEAKTDPKPKAKFASSDPEEESTKPDTKRKAKFGGGGPDIIEDKRYEGLDVEDYSDYLGDSIFMPTGGVEEMNRRRAELQSGWEQGRNMLGQAVIGEIVGGTIEGLGYILEVGNALDYMSGNETEWGNFMTEAGKGLRTWGQDKMAIHQENPGKFDPSDSGWWFSNGVSVASTLSMLLPSMAATKALGFLGKGASKIGGRFSKVLDVAGNMGKQATWMTEGISQAVVSRHIENSMEASGTFESAKADYLGRVNKETGLMFTEEEATKRASEAAASNYNKGWAMLLQDIPQYLALGKIFNPNTGRMENALSKASQSGKAIKLKPWQQKVGGGLGTFISEGAEESYQYYIAERAKAMADLNAGLINRDQYDQIMDDAIGSDEMMTSAFFGGLGGNLFQAAGRGVTEIGKGKKRRDFEKNYESTYRTTLNDRAKNFMAMQQELAEADNLDNLEGREMVLDQMMLMMTTDALHRGKFDQHIETLQGVANMTNEEAKAFAADGDNFNMELAKKSIPEIIKKSEQMRMDYLKFSNKYDNNIAAKMAANNYQNRRFAESTNKMDKKIQDVTHSVPGADGISMTQMQKVEGVIKLRALTEANKALEEEFKNPNTSTLQKPHIMKLIKDNEKRIAKYTLDYQALKGDDPRDSDQKKKDARLAEGFNKDITDELVEAHKVKELNDIRTYLNQKENADISKKSYRDGLKKEDLKEKMAEPIETPEQGEELKKEIEEADYLTKDEKKKEAAVVNENIEELANEASLDQEYKNEEALKNEKLKEVSDAEKKNPSTITNRNTAPVTDNIEDEFSEEQTTTVKDQKSKEKGVSRKVNAKAGENIKVPLYANLNGPGWKDWVFNGRDKTGDKDGKPVLLDFVVGQPGGQNKGLAQQAVNIYNRSLANPKDKLSEAEKDILFNHIPIKIQLTEDIWSYIPAFSASNQFFKTNELPKREAIIRQMFKGNSKTQVTYQFGGNLNIEETEDNSIPENSIMDFRFIDGNMGKVDLMVTNEHGTLVSVDDKHGHPDFEGFQIKVLGTQDDKGRPVPYKGGVFLNVPKANGNPFPLKLNLRRPNTLEATFVADLLIAVITKKLGKKTKLTNHPELFKRFKEDHPDEFSVLGKDAQVMDVAKLFVHMTAETEGKATHLHLAGEWIHYGTDVNAIVTPANLADNRDALIGFIQDFKRRQLNLKQWNHATIGPKYRKMMLNTVVSTDAVVNKEKPLFNENETFGRDNELGAFKSDIGFKVPVKKPKATKVAPKEATTTNKDIDRRQAWSDNAGVVDNQNGTFEGYFEKSSGKRIDIIGKNEEHVKELIKSRYDAERLDQPAQKAATVIKEVPAEETSDVVEESPKYEGFDESFDGFAAERDSELDKFRKAKEDRAKSNEPVSDGIFKKFEDSGTVSKMQLNKIANKIVSDDLLSTRENAIFTDKTAEVNEILADIKAKEDIIARNKMAERELDIEQTEIEFDSVEEAKDAVDNSKEVKKDNDPNKDDDFTEQGEWDCII
jgi:hypothetical protein